MQPDQEIWKQLQNMGAPGTVVAVALDCGTDRPEFARKLYEKGMPDGVVHYAIESLNGYTAANELYFARFNQNIVFQHALPVTGCFKNAFIAVIGLSVIGIFTVHPGFWVTGFVIALLIAWMLMGQNSTISQHNTITYSRLAGLGISQDDLALITWSRPVNDLTE